MRIQFAVTTLIDRIVLGVMNFKAFTLFYNGLTANTFPLEDADTTVSDYISNSATSKLFKIDPPVYCTSVSLNMKSTIVANQNKYLGYYVLSDLLTDFDGRTPSAANYKPQKVPQNYRQRLSDGATRIHNVGNNWQVALRVEYINQSLRDDLKEIFDNKQDFIFHFNGATTGWDGFIFPCVWDGGFEFFQVSDNASDLRFSGSMLLFETPK